MQYLRALHDLRICPEPLRNSRSFGSGQKPPCRIHRPRTSSCVNPESTGCRDEIVVHTHRAEEFVLSGSWLLFCKSPSRLDALIAHPLPRPHPNSESNRRSLCRWPNSSARHSLSILRRTLSRRMTSRSPPSVGRAGVDDDDFSFAVSHQRLHAFQRAADVRFFVKCDDDDGEVHGWNAAIPSSRVCLRTRNCLTPQGLKPGGIGRLTRP